VFGGRYDRLASRVAPCDPNGPWCSEPRRRARFEPLNRFGPVQPIMPGTPNAAITT